MVLFKLADKTTLISTLRGVLITRYGTPRRIHSWPSNSSTELNNLLFPFWKFAGKISHSQRVQSTCLDSMACLNLDSRSSRFWAQTGTQKMASKKTSPIKTFRSLKILFLPLSNVIYATFRPRLYSICEILKRCFIVADSGRIPTAAL